MNLMQILLLVISGFIKERGIDNYSPLNNRLWCVLGTISLCVTSRVCVRVVILFLLFYGQLVDTNHVFSNTVVYHHIASFIKNRRTLSTIDFSNLRMMWR